MTKNRNHVGTTNNSSSTNTSMPEGNQAKWHKWSKEEEDVILQQVKLYPENLQKAFEESSRILPLRSQKSCCARWYKVISVREGKDSVALMCVSSKKFGRNRKNIKESVSIQKNSAWARIWGNITSFFK